MMCTFLIPAVDYLCNQLVRTDNLTSLLKESTSGFADPFYDCFLFY
jgi:hypothetical protein